MKINNIRYFFKEAFTSLSRNRYLTVATISTMAVCILFLGVAVLLTINAGNFMNQLESDIEIIAYLDNTLTNDRIADLQKEIEQTEGVQKTVLVSKDEALQKIQGKFKDQDYDLEKTLGKNPLPNSYDIKVQNPQQIAQVAERIEQIDGIYKVNYGQGLVERLFQVTK